MADLICDCGREPTIYIKCPTATSPGFLAQIKCECGQEGCECWDVRIPWDDILHDWNDGNERALRAAMRDGLVRREGRKYVLTDMGMAELERRLLDINGLN
jgi:hypothetical protein